MKIEQIIQEKIKNFFVQQYDTEINDNLIQLQKTRKEFSGDITVVTFPFLKLTKKSPEISGAEIGDFLKKEIGYIQDFNTVKGFLNLEISSGFWLSFLNKKIESGALVEIFSEENTKNIVVEYSSPNTNKPLHLGHIRNNLLGYSVASILKANGYKTSMVNLVNDRGIHICKSMLAWQKWGKNETPDSINRKGDHLVGDYYVKFDVEYKKEIKELVSSGKSKEEAEKNAPLIEEAQEMLRKWEDDDPEVREVWKEMNSWVYKGFDETYRKLGVSFDKIYHESETYKLGKKIVLEALEKNILVKKSDGSVWADMTKEGLDEKILLRSDGTSVYMTQDVGTANLRYQDYQFDEHIYVVGNEQNYHFQALSHILKKLGFDWANNLNHLSYGMVELPEGKMKSREGTVVDADDLMDEMINTARKMSKELGKLDGFPEEEKENIYRIIGLGALKYFILKVDPKKNMTFNPKESIDFNGNTGPFIQYTYARIKSILRKAREQKIEFSNSVSSELKLDAKELQLIKMLYYYPELLQEAGKNHSPALIANYLYEIAKEYNQFYHEYPMLKEEDVELKNLRLVLSLKTSELIKHATSLLGIEVPERM